MRQRFSIYRTLNVGAWGGREKLLRIQCCDDKIQEFMGYCLIPTTKAQKMLMIIGKGGEGKSRVGVVLHALLGDSVANGNLNKVETNRFARADLERTLLMVDDDMKTEGLPQTNYLKSMITAELPMDLEKKGQQSYQGGSPCPFPRFRKRIAQGAL